jgi:EAL domain-containing protein (putative c-di-GMP-specific phosphodiesterase class I)
MNHDSLHFFGQRVLVPATGEVLYTELLARSAQVPDIARFVREAEAMGAIAAVDVHSLKLALRLLRSDPNIRVGVNMSPHTPMLEPETLRVVIGAFEPYPDRLFVEIGSAALAGAEDRLLDCVNAFRYVKARIVLDGFLDGSNTLGRAQRLRPEYLKVSYVEQRSREYLEQGIKFAGRASAELIAVGVETPATAGWLTQLGVTLQQGWLHHRPELIAG